jgi:hypothetical protein
MHIGYAASRKSLFLSRGPFVARRLLRSRVFTHGVFQNYIIGVEPTTSGSGGRRFSEEEIAISTLLTLIFKRGDILVHQVSDWGSGVAIKMGRRQGATKEHI